MRPRDRAAADYAVRALLCKEASAETHRGASAVLASLGIDEHLALAGAREAVRPPGVVGALSKDTALAGAVVVRTPLDGGGTLSIELTAGEALGLAGAVQDALYRRH